MKVKVGDKIYDGELEPVMVILSDTDKHNIRNMSPFSQRYAVFPDNYPDEDMKAWMDISSQESNT